MGELLGGDLKRKRRYITPKMRQAVYDKFGGRCAYCGMPVQLSESRTYRMQVDHLVPFSKGGSDGIDNLMPACPTCNYWKADLFLEDFRHLCLAFREGAPYFTRKQREWIKGHLLDVDRTLARGNPLRFAFEQAASGQDMRSKRLIPKGEW